MATANPILADDHPIILFDGECNLCNASVRFVLKRDRTEHFRFASLQSDTARDLLRAHHIPPDNTSIVLLEHGQAYLRSAAALRVARGLRFPWPMLYALILLPRPFRDGVYNFVARHRYRWFGRGQMCSIDPLRQAQLKAALAEA